MIMFCSKLKAKMKTEIESDNFLFPVNWIIYQLHNQLT